MIAFLFPGQGSQYPGMGKELSDNFAVARQVFEEASDALSLDMAALCFEGCEEDLKLTANTQPAILTTSIAALRVLEAETELVPVLSAGHSLGEFSALVSAGALEFADAVRIVRQRGSFMQQAVPVGVGAMAAVMGIDSAELEQICTDAAQGEVVSPANFNSPIQTVIAGNKDAVLRAVALASERGAKRAMLLPVSAPFHCALMQPAAEQLAAVLATISFKPFRFPVVGNVEAKPYSDPAQVADLLVRQVCSAVRWTESAQQMAQQGVKRYIEIGPGKVLGGLLKRIVARDSRIEQFDRPKSLESLCGQG